MSNISVDLDGLAFNAHGQQIGLVIPDEYLDQISGGREASGNNQKCGDNCAGSNNASCGRYCFA